MPTKLRMKKLLAVRRVEDDWRVRTLDMNTADKNRWLILGLVSLAEMLAISCWLVSSAISSQLEERWELVDWQTAALVTSVQLGFVAGTLLAAFFNLADLLPSRWYFAVAALLTGLANLGLLVSEGFSTAVLFRFLVGFFLAGVYPPAMKMIATWFQQHRGLAIGTLIGALVMGKATPFLLKTFHITDWQLIVSVSTLGAVVAAILVGVGYRDGPYSFQRKPFSLKLIGEVVAHQKTRLAIGGYLGHMWELYAMWTWVGIFMAAAAVRHGVTDPWLVSAATFAIIAVGAIGCVLGGRWSDRFGREKFVNLAMAVSGICCVAIGFGYAFGFWICVAIALIWGFFVVADSAQFSTMVTEDCPPHAVGTALTLQTSIGFLLTTLTIQLVPWLQASSHI